MTAVLVNDLGRTLDRATTSRKNSIPHLVPAGVGSSKDITVMPALGQAFAPVAPGGGAGTSDGVRHSVAGWTMMGVEAAVFIPRRGRRVEAHVGRKEALREEPQRRWRR